MTLPVRILLVDDSPEFLDSADHFLSLEGAVRVVGRASSGEEALVEVGRLRPDLVLMDVSMPGMNGFETARRLKAAADAPRVLILTAHDNAEYRAAQIASRADGFLAKAQFGTELLPLVHAWFGLLRREEPALAAPN